MSESLAPNEAFEFILVVFKNSSDNASATAYQIWEDGYGDALQ